MLPDCLVMLCGCEVENNSETCSVSARKSTLLAGSALSLPSREAHVQCLLCSTGFGGQSRNLGMFQYWGKVRTCDRHTRDIRGPGNSKQRLTLEVVTVNQGRLTGSNGDAAAGLVSPDQILVPGIVVRGR